MNIEGKLVYKHKHKGMTVKIQQDSLKMRRRNCTENNTFEFWTVTLFSLLTSENTRTSKLILCQNGRC